MADEIGSEQISQRAKAADAFVELVDALVEDFDVIDVLTVLSTRCVELLGAAAAGIMLVDGEGTLRVIGASNEQANLLELLQLQNDEGPCLDSFRTGHIVTSWNLSAESPWPAFAAVSVATGYRSVCAIPMRLRGFTMGCLNLFIDEPVSLPDDDIVFARGLAHVAAIAIAQDQTTRELEVRDSQWHHALQSRVVIEQAKGMIAVQSRVDMDGAFRRLRSYARDNDQRLTDVATDVIAGTTIIGSDETIRSAPPSPDDHPSSS